jgi:monovalent cation:H+ antiporter-2, CPA2 family
MTIDALSPYKDALIVLGTAGLIMPAFLRFGINSILGFLIIGVLLGPHVLGQAELFFPQLAGFEISDMRDATGLAELGVVFLLFLIGLELSFERLKTMRRLVFGLGGLQVLLSTAALATLAKVWGYSAIESLVIGAALGLSSTAIVIQLLAQQKRTGSQAGRISFGVLLMQDLAVIPMLLFITAMAQPEQKSIVLSLAWAIATAAVAALGIFVVGRKILGPILRFVAGAKSSDLFMAAVLFIALGAGVLATSFGLSMSLGAFIAGLLLAETEYRRAIEAMIEPFKGLLLGLFFLLVGLNLDLSLLSSQALTILLLALAFVAVKSVIVMALAIIFKLPKRSGLEAALLLGPGGEFAFVLLAAAKSAGLISQEAASPILLIVTLSMFAIPFMSLLATYLRRTLEKTRPIMKAVALPTEADAGRVIIAGFGRVGTVVADMLKDQGVSYIAADLDAKGVETARFRGYNAHFGNAADLSFLRACGLATAKTLAITMDDPARSDEILRAARAERPDRADLRIIVRARDIKHAQRLYAEGANEAVLETVEASLQLAEAIMVETGVPMGLAIAAVHEKRDTYRKTLGSPNRREQLARSRQRVNDKLK